MSNSGRLTAEMMILMMTIIPDTNYLVFLVFYFAHDFVECMLRIRMSQSIFKVQFISIPKFLQIGSAGLVVKA